MSYARGWNKGLKEGLFGSGFLLGTALPILFIVAIISAGIWGWVRLFSNGPGYCANYSFEVGLLHKSEMTCTHWPAMEMRIEKRMVRSTIVHCTCTQASNPKRSP